MCFFYEIFEIITHDDRRKHMLSHVLFSDLAEEAGFEPARALQLLSVFETDLFNHLSIPPAVFSISEIQTFVITFS